jgi:excisionase family DNA binding protein
MATQPIRISPADDAEKEQVRKLYRMLILEGSAALVGPDNSKIELPPSIYDVLVKVVEQMQEGKTIGLMPVMEELSTQAAADMLGMSRQFLVRELEAGKIRFHRTGAHRRVYFKDVLDYKKQRQEQRDSAIDRIAQKSEELGVYDKFIPPDE